VSEPGKGADLKGWAAAVVVGVVAYFGFSYMAGSGGQPGGGPENGSPRPRHSPEGPGAPAPGQRSLGIEFRAVDEGLEVHTVLEGGSADAAGLLVGDLILAVDGDSVAADAGGGALLLERLGSVAAEDGLVLTVRRADGSEADLAVAFVAEGAFERDLAGRLIAAAVEQVLAERRDDGLWPGYQDPERPSTAVTALVAYALRRAGAPPGYEERLPDLQAEVTADLLEHVGEDGGLTDPAELYPHRTYGTALLLLALGDDAETADAREGLAGWLRRAQVQEARPDGLAGNDFGHYDPRYGGWSYYDTYASSRLRTDVSTARYALQALAAAGTPPDAPVWLRARLFLDLSHNQTRVTGPGDPDAAREVRYRDGGFAFGPRMSKAGAAPVGDRLVVYASYGSATVDGLLSLLCVDGVDARGAAPEALPGDERQLAALRWLAGRYDLTENPGFPPERAAWSQGIFYYYLAGLAEALHRAGVWEVTGWDGTAHVWAAELVRLLGNVQNRQGRFANPSRLMHEDGPTLGGCLAIVALAAARDRLAVGGGVELEAGQAPDLLPQDLAPVAPAPKDAVARGERIFTGRGACAGCHVPGGAGNGPPLGRIGADYLLRYRSEEAARARLRRYLEDPQGTGTVATPPGAWPEGSMPSATAGPAQLTDAEVDDVVAYLLSRVGD